MSNDNAYLSKDLLNFKMKFENKEKLTENESRTLYSVKFCDVLPDYRNYFVTVGKNFTNVFRISDNDSSSTELCLALIDEDPEECLYCSAWSSSKEGYPIVLRGGLKGIVKGTNCITHTLDVVLLGHGNIVNDIKTHPLEDSICFTASKDESIRMWCLRSSSCLAIFAGEKGHKLDVLTISIHHLGNCFASGGDLFPLIIKYYESKYILGMDTSIKIWNLDEPEVKAVIQECLRRQGIEDYNHFETIIVHFPVFSTTQVHSDYVDNVIWVGDCILSQAVRDKIVMWTPHSERYKGAALILREFDITGLDTWFVEMDVSIPLNILAIGNCKGLVLIYNLDASTYDSSILDDDDLRNEDSDEEPDGDIVRLPYTPQAPHLILQTNAHWGKFIRQVSFSRHSDFLVGCSEGGGIYVWNISSV